MKLNEDGTLSLSAGTLSLSAATLTAEEVDELITKLATARSKMSPGVPAQPARDGSLFVQQQPAIMVSRAREGGITLGLRHAGFGWVTFILQEADAAALQAFLAKRTAGQKVRLIDDDEEGQVTTH